MKPTMVMICGYARSGKDTLAGILEKQIYRDVINGIVPHPGIPGIYHLADPIKYAGSLVLSSMGRGQYSQPHHRGTLQPKEKLRPMWIGIGTTMRLLDEDYLARELLEAILEEGGRNDTVRTLPIICDWRYLNEYMYLKKHLPEVRIITVLLERPHLAPSGEEERSIHEIKMSGVIDLEFRCEYGELSVLDGLAGKIVEKIYE